MSRRPGKSPAAAPARGSVGGDGARARIRRPRRRRPPARDRAAAARAGTPSCSASRAAACRSPQRWPLAGGLSARRPRRAQGRAPAPARVRAGRGERGRRRRCPRTCPRDLVAPQLERAREQALALRAGRDREPLRDRPVVIVDDGLATGRSMAVALDDGASRGRGPPGDGRAGRLGARVAGARRRRARPTPSRSSSRPSSSPSASSTTTSRRSTTPRCAAAGARGRRVERPAHRPRSLRADARAGHRERRERSGTRPRARCSPRATRCARSCAIPSAPRAWCPRASSWCAAT